MPPTSAHRRSHETVLVVCWDSRHVVRCACQHQRIYSCNEGNFDSWDEEIKRAVMGFKTESPPWAQRYVGSMVSDVHRTLLYGGLFLYPADKKSSKGKRLSASFQRTVFLRKGGKGAPTSTEGEAAPLRGYGCREWVCRPLTVFLRRTAKGDDRHSIAQRRPFIYLVLPHLILTAPFECFLRDDACVSWRDWTSSLPGSSHMVHDRQPTQRVQLRCPFLVSSLTTLYAPHFPSKIVRKNRQAAGALRGIPDGAHHRAGGRRGLNGHVQRIRWPGTRDCAQGHSRAVPDHHREPQLC